MAGDRTVKVPAVFVADPETLQVRVYAQGDEIPEGVEVGGHVFRDAPDYTGTPQTGPTIGSGALIGPGPVAAGGEGGEGSAPEGEAALVAKALERDVDGVKAYADNHPDRVPAMLDQERAGENRKTVVAYLEKLAGSPS